MAKSAYMGNDYAGNYNREHLGLSSNEEKQVASVMANLVQTDPLFNDIYNLQHEVWSANEAAARAQMDFQSEANNKAMVFSAEEAQKNREWQERLSNTAHQREVNDLIAAGLNPVLSANAGAFTGSGGYGSGVTSAGAMAQHDSPIPSIIGNLLLNRINNAHQAEITGMYNEAQLASSAMSLQGSQAVAGAQVAAAQIAAETKLLEQERGQNWQTKENSMDRILKRWEKTQDVNSAKTIQSMKNAMEELSINEKHFDSMNPLGNLRGLTNDIAKTIDGFLEKR